MEDLTSILLSTWASRGSTRAEGWVERCKGEEFKETKDLEPLRNLMGLQFTGRGPVVSC